MARLKVGPLSKGVLPRLKWIPRKNSESESPQRFLSKEWFRLTLDLVDGSQAMECRLKYVVFTHDCKTNGAVCQVLCSEWLSVEHYFHMSS
jgi:hypothetical protein